MFRGTGKMVLGKLFESKKKNRGKAVDRKFYQVQNFRGNTFWGNQQEFENPGVTGKGKSGKTKSPTPFFQGKCQGKYPFCQNKKNHFGALSPCYWAKISEEMNKYEPRERRKNSQKLSLSKITKYSNLYKSLLDLVWEQPTRRSGGHFPQSFRLPIAMRNQRLTTIGYCKNYS